MAERKVVLDGIVRIEPRQSASDFLRRLPGYVFPLRQPEVPGKFVDVRVDRAYEQPRAHTPKAQVDAIGRSYHPAQEEEESLGPTAAERVREDVVGAAAPDEARDVPSPLPGAMQRQSSSAPDGIAECGEGFAEVPSLPEIILEASAQRTVSALDTTCPDDQARYVLPTEDSVNPAIHPREDAKLIIGGERRPRAEAAEGIVELGADGLDVAERHRSGKERHDFLIARVEEAVDRVHGVGGSPRGNVATRPDLLERAADTPEATGAVLRTAGGHAFS
jgi:hypothetical protein